MTVNRRYQIACYVPKSLHAEIRAMADRRATTAQEVIRDALEKNLEDVIESHRKSPAPKGQMQGPATAGENEEKVQLNTRLTKDLKKKIRGAVVEHQITVAAIVNAVLERYLRPVEETSPSERKTQDSQNNWPDPGHSAGQHATPHPEDEEQQDSDELNWAEKLRETWYINRTEHINPNVQEDELVKVERILKGLERNGKILKPLLWPTFTCKSCRATKETLRDMRSITSQSAICTDCFDQGKRIATRSEGRAFAKTILLDINDEETRKHLIGNPDQPTGAWIVDIQAGIRIWPPDSGADKLQQEMPLQPQSDFQKVIPFDLITTNPESGEGPEMNEQETNMEFREEDNSEPGEESNMEFGEEDNSEPGEESNMEFGEETNSEPGEETDSEPGEETDSEPGEEIRLEPYMISDYPGEPHYHNRVPVDLANLKPDQKFVHAGESRQIPEIYRNVNDAKRRRTQICRELGIKTGQGTTRICSCYVTKWPQQPPELPPPNPRNKNGQGSHQSNGAADHVANEIHQQNGNQPEHHPEQEEDGKETENSQNYNNSQENFDNLSDWEHFDFIEDGEEEDRVELQEPYSPPQTPHGLPYVIRFATESGDIPWNVRAMVILLSRYADHNGKASVAVSTLCETARIGSKNTVERWINLAAGVGILRKDPGRGGNGRKSNTYIFLGKDRDWEPLPQGKPGINPLVELAQVRRQNEELQNRIHKLENYNSGPTDTSTTSKDFEWTDPNSREAFERLSNEKTWSTKKEFNSFMHELYMHDLEGHIDPLKKAINQSDPNLIKKRLVQILHVINSWSST